MPLVNEERKKSSEKTGMTAMLTFSRGDGGPSWYFVFQNKGAH
jgi:hypothetical protein